MPHTYTYKSVNVPKVIKQIIEQVKTNLISELSPLGITTINYEYGTWNYITKMLAEKAQAKQSNEAFPLVALITDYVKDFDKNSTVFETSLRIVICNVTDWNKYNDQRYADNFEAILYPVYDEFMAVCQNSNLFYGYNGNGFSHSVSERPFMDADGVNALKLNEVLDGIIINEMEVQFEKIKVCK